MRTFKLLAIAALVVGMGTASYAELQNVEVNGSIRIRGNLFDFDEIVTNPGIFGFGRRTVSTETSFVEQRTRLGVCADFTDEVKAVIEFDSYDIWGSSFRSNYITGIDTPEAGIATSNDVDLHQAYIQAEEMWGTPLRLRVGRQEISLGSEWLVGVNDASSIFTGLNFDAIRMTYATDMFSVDAIAAKLNETFDSFSNGDVDLYALYASYLGLEDITIDAYWMMVNDNASLTAFNVDLHTIGLRGAGTIGAFDFEAEAAYQFGQAEIDRRFFLARDIEFDFDSLGVNLEAGYTFDMNYTPRVFLGAAYLEGGDNDTSGLRNFFRRDEPDLSFNRLFSNWEYSEFLENTDLSNVIVYRAGLSGNPTEALSLALAATYFEVDEPTRTGILLQREADDTLGVELGLYGDYQYSEDLVFRAGYAHFFGDDGLGDRQRFLFIPLGRLFNNSVGNGLLPIVGDEDDDFDYLFIEAEVKF